MVCQRSIVWLERHQKEIEQQSPRRCKAEERAWSRAGSGSSEGCKLTTYKLARVSFDKEEALAVHVLANAEAGIEVSRSALFRFGREWAGTFHEEKLDVHQSGAVGSEDGSDGSSLQAVAIHDISRFNFNVVLSALLDPHDGALRLASGGLLSEAWVVSH